MFLFVQLRPALALALALAPLAALGAGSTGDAPPPPVSGWVWPWESQNAPDPPDMPPYELPTLRGDKDPIQAPVGGLVPAPRVDGDAVFLRVLQCYPAPSLFNVDIRLRASYTPGFGGADAADGTDLGGVYAGIVASMPLYSSTEIDRERERELRRRRDTAKTAADFVTAITKRNLAARLLGLYSSLEGRSRHRIAAGVASTDEQVTFLEKTAKAAEDLATAETAIMEHRLALVAGCDDGRADNLNTYLSRLAQLPRAEGAR